MGLWHSWQGNAFRNLELNCSNQVREGKESSNEKPKTELACDGC